MPSWIIAILGGIWGYVAAFAIGTVLATSATYEIVHNANAVEISNLKLDAQTLQTKSVSASLTQLQGFISIMHTAENGYQTALAQINDAFAALEKEFKNATAKPLPADCRPDAARLRVLSDAIAATNNTTTPTK